MKRTRTSSGRKSKRQRCDPVRRRLSFPITTITRKCEKATFTMAAVTGTWTQSNYVFRLGDLPGFGEMTSMFDQYQITSIRIDVLPRYRDQTLGQGTSAVATPFILMAECNDGSQNLFTKSQALQTSNAVHVKDPYKPFGMTIRPKFLVETAVGVGIAASYSKNGWIDTDNNQVDHYGFALAGDTPGYGTSAFNPLVYDIYATFTIKLRNPR